jgi:hypothetical protein
LNKFYDSLLRLKIEWNGEHSGYALLEIIEQVEGSDDFKPHKTESKKLYALCAQLQSFLLIT